MVLLHSRMIISAIPDFVNNVGSEVFLTMNGIYISRLQQDNAG